MCEGNHTRPCLARAEKRLRASGGRIGSLAWRLLDLSTLFILRREDLPLRVVASLSRHASHIRQSQSTPI